MRLLQLTALVSALALAASSASATSLGLITLPEGNTILQATDTFAGVTDGGTATADTRTVYYFQPDFGQPQPNEHDYTGPAWPYVYTNGSLLVDPGISATVETFNDGFGDVILVDGNPLYQFVNDLTASDAFGNFTVWFYVEPDGTATQNPVPEPGTAALLSLGLVALAARRR